MADDAAEFLIGAGQKAGDVFERDDRDIEGVAEADEAGAFDRGIDIEAAGEKCRLVSDDADRSAIKTREAYDDVLREVLVDFEEITVIDDAVDDVLDVVGLIGFGGDDACRVRDRRGRSGQCWRGEARLRDCSAGGS